MNAKTLTLLVALLVSFPAGYAAIGNYEFWEECDGVTNSSGYNSDNDYSYQRYTECAPEGVFPDLVTGHTVYAKWISTENRTYDANVDFANRTLGLPTDFAALAGYYYESRYDYYPPGFDVNEYAWQRECVVWFNGDELTGVPDPDEYGTNNFPSDEDEKGGFAADRDSSRQDYDFGRDVDSCGLEENVVYGDNPSNYTANFTYSYGTYAVVVEEGDCNPVANGGDFRFRGHLDFSDPNGIFHEVQEYDYTCLYSQQSLLELTGYQSGADGCDDVRARSTGQNYGSDDQDGGVDYTTGDPTDPANYSTNDVSATFNGAGPCVLVPEGAGASVAKQLFPWTYTDETNEDGCAVHATPAQTNDVSNATVDPDAPADPTDTDDVNDTSPTADPKAGHFDLGHKCNGTIQDLFTERLWMTRVHAPVLDPRLNELYTFALMVDTCDGLNVFELEGKPDDPTEKPRLLRDIGVSGPFGIGVDTGMSPYDVTNTASKAGVRGLEKFCTDGSSFSFDDTNRGHVTHSGVPTSTEDVMRGNSEGAAGFGTTAPLQHRETCRANTDSAGNPIDWPMNDNPPGVNQGSCYPEDHRTAAVDLFIYDVNVVSSTLFDLFEANSAAASTFSGYGAIGYSDAHACTVDSGSYGSYGAEASGYANQDPCHP